MKSLLFALLLSFGTFLTSNSSSAIRANPVDSTVYICTGPKSVAYHKTTKCMGLKKCSKEVKAVSLEEAVNIYKRTECGICYK